MTRLGWRQVMPRPLTREPALTAERQKAQDMKRRASRQAGRSCGVMLQRLRAAPWATLTALCLMAGCASRIDRVRINQAQVIGTHNSYHLRTHDSLLSPIAKQGRNSRGGWITAIVPCRSNCPGLASARLNWTALPIPRAVCMPSPEAPSWRPPSACRQCPNHDPEHRLRAPGFKVMHVQDIDYFSTVLTLVEGLQQVRTWSEQHPRHFPIFIYLELKEDQYLPMLTRPLPFGERELEALEAEISVGVSAATDPDAG